jgi:hypothetical protein
MGIERSVTFPDKPVPTWPALKGFLGERGSPVQLRMIDGDLAIPDEVPPEGWRELRLSTPQGMVTLRRENARIVLVTWGNADAALVQAWNGLVWALAEVGGGLIESPNGLLTPAEFGRVADLPSSLGGDT